MPAEYTVVGKTHCQLERQVSGDYRVNLLGEHYVEINGVPADNSAWFPTAARFGSATRRPDRRSRSRSTKGKAPSCRTRGPQTEGQVVARADGRDQAARRWPVRRALLCCSLASSAISCCARHRSRSRSPSANAAASELAPEGILGGHAGQARGRRLSRRQGGGRQAQGRGDGMGLPDSCRNHAARTNAHVTEAIKGHEDEFFLVASRRQAYQDQESHLASGLSRLRQIQDDARHHPLRQFHPARPDQRI